MPAIMLQGTGSSVGKSLLVAGLARALTARGLRVRPFKPQNMSNNAAVASDGGEIGRAQALQARAAKVAASVHMNPVLLKPQSETGAQIVLRGRVHATATARAYQAMKPDLLPFVLDSFRTVERDCDVVLVEGAGSASEVNLRAGDIANMGFARATQTPVVLVGDIDRGGVIASLVGTHTVLDAEDAAMIKGFVVNRIRGDASLFDAGMTAITRHTGWRHFGLVPFFDRAHLLPAEDAADLTAASKGDGKLRIAVPLLPHIANFDDLDPLSAEPDVSLLLVARGSPLPWCDLIILPGSKVTRADLRALREEGWDIDLAAHRRRGGMILGICGGYQMLGRSIADPHGVEGGAGTDPGLGMLDVDTVLTRDKRVARASGISVADDAAFTGYEIHAGRTNGPDTTRPLLRFADGRRDGAVSLDGRVLGTYVHGLFGDDAQRARWLARLGGISRVENYDALIETALDELAAHLEAHMDIDALLRIAS